MPRDRKAAVRTRKSSVSDKLVAPPADSSRSQHATVTLIVDSARRVLIERGHAGLTTRLVAKAAGISPGNLSYHFPSKSALLQAVIARMLNDYASQFELLVTNPELTPGRELQSIVQWLMSDSVSPETVRVFRELWAMSLHDEGIRNVVDNFYDQAILSVERLLQRVYPNADKTSISELVHVFAHFSEGGAVLYGTRRQRTVPYERIMELVTPLLASLLVDVQNRATPKTKASRKKSRS